MLVYINSQAITQEIWPEIPQIRGADQKQFSFKEYHKSQINSLRLIGEKVQVDLICFRIYRFLSEIPPPLSPHFNVVTLADTLLWEGGKGFVWEEHHSTQQGLKQSKLFVWQNDKN